MNVIQRVNRLYRHFDHNYHDLKPNFDDSLQRFLFKWSVTFIEPRVRDPQVFRKR